MNSNDTLPSRPRSARLEARISQEQKDLFQRAATLQNRSLTDFIVNSVQEAAIQTVQQYEVMKLTAEDQAVFVSALLEDAEPSLRLKAAYRRYQERMGH